MTGNVGAITQSAMFESLPTNIRCDEQISDRVQKRFGKVVSTGQ